MGTWDLLILFYDQPARLIVSAICAYFLGCSNGAVIISKYILRDDVRTHGSGNAGLTNFFRTFGGPLTLAVILIDVLKAVLAVVVGVWLSDFLPFGMGATIHTESVTLASGMTFVIDPVLHVIFYKYWAGLFCLLGHMFPCMFGFKGGKGILSGGTIAWMIDWRLALLVWGGFLLLTVLTRYVSLGSVYAAAFFPVGTWLFVGHDPVIMVLSVLLGGLILWKHRGNIQRLLKGEESKLSFHKKKGDSST